MKQLAQVVVFFLGISQPYFNKAIAAPWTTNGSLVYPRRYQSATLLPNGDVLAIGGEGNTYSSRTTERYNALTGTWSTNQPPLLGRERHTATLLFNGKVLVAGGNVVASTNISTAELYDPSTDTWLPTGSMHYPRVFHTATLLTNGMVLVAGGATALLSSSSATASAELYNPATGQWTLTASMPVARCLHTATLLPNGKVLVVGGANTRTIDNVDIYDPVSGTWSQAASLGTARNQHTATLLSDGKVVVIGGSSLGDKSTEIFDTATGTWTYSGASTVFRGGHTATLLPSGRILVTGGYTNADTSTAEVFDATAGTSTSTASMLLPRADHTATLLANGRVMIVGGNSYTWTELYESASGTWSSTGALSAARMNHTATLLPTGKVLAVGGYINSSGLSLTNTDLYDPTNGGWTSSGALLAPRSYHTATLLQNGKVLVAGGYGNSGVLKTAELYDPLGGTWAATGALVTNRIYHTANLLANGKVLVAGGFIYQAGFMYPQVTELYDPFTGTWSASGQIGTGREYHTATTLPDGKVLVAGGDRNADASGTYLSAAELYDPATAAWTATGTMKFNRTHHTATLLANGKVLVAGGVNGSYVLPAELYDPATGTWSQTGSLIYACQFHSAILLPNGKVLIAGGLNADNAAQLYDPIAQTWSATGSLTLARRNAAIACTASGNILIVGGLGSDLTPTAELYDIGLGFHSRPQVEPFDAALPMTSIFTVDGQGFRGVAGTSSGSHQGSSSDNPVIHLRSLETGQIASIGWSTWSPDSIGAGPLSNILPGWALLSVTVNGIPSSDQIVNVGVPAPAITAATRLADGSFQLSFTNLQDTHFAIYATTSLTSPATWTSVGDAVQTSPGNFQFTDTAAKNQPQRFYRATSR